MLMKIRQSKVLKSPSIIQAPKWLARRMETLQRMPPPTLEEVAIHLKASGEIRKRLTAKRSS